jgi:hypothetical protein
METVQCRARSRRLSLRRLSLTVGSILLATAQAACVSTPLPGFGPDAPGLPNTHAVTSMAAEAIVSIGPSSEGYALSPGQRLQIYYNTTYKLCSDYFDNLIEIQNQTHYTGDVLTAGATMATAMITLRKNMTDAANSIARIAAGGAFANAIVSKFDERALMTPYPTETKGLILAAMSAYETHVKPSTVDDPYLAQSHAMHYAELCTYSGITRSAKEALNAARPEAQDPGGGAPETSGAGSTAAVDGGQTERASNPPPPVIRFPSASAGFTGYRSAPQEIRVRPPPPPARRDGQTVAPPVGNPVNPPH